jgi:chaperonin GroES
MEGIELLEDRVLIETITETVTASGIIIPDTAKEKPMKGRVVAVGPGKKDVEMKLKSDNLVLFGKYSGIEVKLEGKDYLLMRQEDIFMIVNK